MIYFELFISLTSLIMLWLMGNKYKWAPLIGLLNQILWIILVVITKQWGLMIGVIAYTIIHIRNLKKWISETDTGIPNECPNCGSTWMVTGVGTNDWRCLDCNQPVPGLNTSAEKITETEKKSDYNIALEIYRDYDQHREEWLAEHGTMEGFPYHSFYHWVTSHKQGA